METRERVELSHIEGVDAGLGVVEEIEREDADEHSQAGSQHVEREPELPGRGAVPFAPDTNEQVHGNESGRPGTGRSAGSPAT